MKIWRKMEKTQKFDTVKEFIAKSKAETMPKSETKATTKPKAEPTSTPKPFQSGDRTDGDLEVSKRVGSRKQMRERWWRQTCKAFLRQRQ